MSTADRISNIKIPPLAQIVPVLAILMEVFWAYIVLAWIRQIAAWPEVPFNLASCLILALATEILVRFALARKWPVFRVRVVILPLTLLLLIVLIRWSLGGGYAIGDTNWFSYAANEMSAIIVAFLFGIYLIWRGISVGRQPNAFSDLYRRFIIGLAAVIVILILWGFAGEKQGDVWGSVGLEIILFFGSGLLALAIANLETLRIELQEHQEATSSFTRRWISMLVILVVAIIGLSTALVSIFSTNTAGTITHFLGNLWDWLVTGIIYLLYPIGFVAQVLIYVGQFLLKLFGVNTPPPQEITGPIDWSKMMQGQQPSQIPEALLQILKWGAIIAVIGLIVFFLVRALTRYWQAKTEEGVEETNETLWSWKVFSMDLKSVLAWLFRWLPRRKRKPAATSISVFDPASVSADPDRIYSIREIYQALLWEGRQSGTPRRQSETPYEYGKRLKQYNHEISDELDNLTEAYILERYGQVNPEAQKVSWINRLWRSLRAKFHQSE
jgi:hypothetical protein